MKKLCLTALLTVIYISCFSQVVIQGSSFIQPGTILNYQTGSPIWNAEAGLTDISGDNAVWNAEDWASLTDDTEVYNSLSDMSTIVKFFFSNQLLYSANYSTHALGVAADILELPIPIEISDANTYFRTDETGYYGTGLSFAFQGFPLTTQNEEVERIYKFPMHYGDIDSSSLVYLMSIPTIGAYGQNAKRYSEVDGQGTLITPYGTYDVLRVRAERYMTDTIYADMLGGGQSITRPLQIDYAWISPQMKGPILEMSVVGDIIISSRMLFTQSTVSVFNPEKQNLEIYPNPARDFIEFNSPFAEKATVKIYDLQGRLVLKTIPEGKRIQVNSLAPGMYVVKISEKGKDVLTGKVLIIE